MDRYEQISVVGEGSYGLVMKCRHKDTEQIVAIKKFLETEEDAAVRRMALREIRMLKKLRHENLVTMIEVFRHRKRFYLVFEYLDGTVLDELERTPGGLGDERSRERIYQVLRAIHYCHSNQIIHRDVKPENVLVSSLGIVKLCDFGFARLIGINGEPCTEYVATRWYRAPELLVSEQQYGYAVDIWAIGCLFAEMMTGDPLFPGESDIDQLYLIVKLIGKPCPRHQQVMSRSTQLRGLIRSAASDSTGLYREFPSWPLLALDFLNVATRMDPNTRPSAEELLAHNYFTHDKFPARFLPSVRERVNKEFGDNPLLRRYRAEIFMSTDKKDEAIKQVQQQIQQGQRRGSQLEIPRWRINLLEGSIKRKYSCDTNHNESNIVKPTGQKLNFIRREANQSMSFLKTNANINNKIYETDKTTNDILTSKESQNSEIQKLERSLERLSNLSSQRANSAQNNSAKPPPSPPLFQSLQPQLQDNSPTEKSPTNLHGHNNNSNTGQVLQPSIHNISFGNFGKTNGHDFVKKSSPSLLQSISTLRPTPHHHLPTNIPTLSQPRTSHLFLKRLDRNVAIDTLLPPPLQSQPSTNQQQQPQAPPPMLATNQMAAAAAAYDTAPANGVASWLGGTVGVATINTNQSQHSDKAYNKRRGEKELMRDSLFGTMGSFNNNNNNNSKGQIYGKGQMQQGGGFGLGGGENFSLPILPGATSSPMKLKQKAPFVSNSLTLHSITPRIQSATSQKSSNRNLPQM